MQAAIKILDLRDVDEQQFHQEAETTARLVHPNIVRLLDFDVQQGTPFLVLDYAPGGSLRARHPKGSRVLLATVIQYIKELAPALQHAHDQNILHRDIKPDNILIGRQGELLLSDFGIALLSRTGKTSQQGPTGTGGTPPYMAPEQFRGKPEKASDQYALATVVYEWLSGTVPFNDGDWFQLGFQHTYEPVPPLRASTPTLPSSVESVVMKALSKQPQDRFLSIQAFWQALEEASKHPPVGTRLLIYRGHGDAYTRGAWSPDGTRFALGGTSGVVQVRDAHTDTQIWTCEEYVSVVNALAWSPDGTRLASGSIDKTIRIWNASSGQLLSTYTSHADNVNALVWSPDGMRLASGSWDKTVQIWDASSGQQLFTYTGHTNGVNALAWSPDGTRLASGSADKTVQVWDVNSGQVFTTYTGHAHGVHALAWSPDGKCLASGSWDQTVQLWQVSSGQALYTYTGHAAQVNALAWSPDGTRLASGSDDQTVQVWQAV
jgi:serine/threonine protein kinase